MNPKQEASTLPALPLPRLSPRLEGIAVNLARFALEFGVAMNENFGPRLATIGFTNAVLLCRYNPTAAAQLEEFLSSESVPQAGQLIGLAPAFIEAFPGEKNWTDEINVFLRKQWRLSADNEPTVGPRLELHLRILHGIRYGLVVTRESPETAQKIGVLVETLWLENQFLSRCLAVWSQNDWVPFWPPFIEFTASYYCDDTVERYVFTKAIAEAYLIAQTQTNPWSISFWVEAGWDVGRNFAGKEREDCRKILEEAGPKGLKTYQAVYERCLLATAARSDGEVQLERATLRYLGEHANVDLARCNCSGREPRRLARVVFEFGFWMGIFASSPVPIEN